jgi:TetR/AcrR family tetracycline transcriptional repressor
LSLLQKTGLDELTTRNLADALGVKSPALYWHFRSKADLLDAMADALVQDAGMGPPRSGEAWQDWLARRARAYRSSLLAYPDSARIVASAKSLSPATVATFNEELDALLGFGFDAVHALQAITALTNYVSGYVFVLQTRGWQQPASKIDAASASEANPLSDGNPSVLMTAIAEGGSPYSETSFEYGLQALIDGLAAALNRQV